MKLSVIVPCYNVKDYLEICVTSIVNAQVDNMEIILVNDGSKDNTLDIAKSLEEKYPKLIRVINKQNGGLSSARNEGLKFAQGEYVSFIDSDDTIDIIMYKDMITKADSGNYDVVVCNERRIFDDHNQLVESGLTSDCNNKEDVKRIMPYIYPAACNKIYKRELFNDIKFKEGIWYEDVEFIYRLLPKVNSIGKVDGYTYNYYQRSGSITYTYNNKLYDLPNNLNSVIKYYKDNNLFDEYHDEIEYVYVRYLYATFIKRLAKMKNKGEFNKGVKYVINEVNTNFPNYKSNKYMVGKKGTYLKHFSPFISKLIYMLEKNKKN